MITLDYFEPEELVCPHIYRVHGKDSLKFIDPRLAKWLDWFRNKIDRPVFVNNWDMKGSHDERGYRCNLCSLVKAKTENDELYLSAHTRFQAVDFNVQDMLDEEVRQWIERNKRDMPVNIRVEKNTSGWCHVDVCNDSFDKIIYFNG